jgi:glycosyltransferase involved in cell wall biosynthesis
LTDARFDVVVPTVGRPELGRLVASLAASGPPWPGQVILVDDRPVEERSTSLPVDGVGLGCPTRVVATSGQCGPAAARNAGWRSASAEWVVFLDDDVEVAPGWSARLIDDLDGAGADIAAAQGVIDVPLPQRPTDWERNVGRLATAGWITADLAIRRRALAAIGGFDERFRRAYREDTDIALRLNGAGWRVVRGRRRSRHPVGPADAWVSVRLQRGNADDVLMDRLHGSNWRQAIGERPGRIGFHRAVVGFELVAVLAAVGRRRRLAELAAAAALASTASFAASRIRPGPRTRREIRTMVVTSALIPPVAVWHRLRGRLRYRAPVPPWISARPDVPLRSI